MRPLSTTEHDPLEFHPSVGETKRTIAIPSAKIGWIHSIADRPGATFDITIKDALGRVKFERKQCGTETEKFGELVNLPTLLGEELEIVVGNLQGAEKLKIFLN